MRPRSLLAALLLSCLTLTALDAGDRSPFDPLRSGVDAVVGPVDVAVGSAASSVRGVVASFGDEGALADLREENDRLRRELARDEASQRRVAELDALLGVTADLETVPARVVAVGAALGFGRTVTLDVGSGDGVREDLTVIGGAGLVGRTVRVGPATTTVLLLDDPEFGVGARLAREGTLGLARGDGDGGLVYTQVEGGPVEAGEVLLTTGSGTFVADVPIGVVREVRSTAGGLTSAADVEPYAQLGALDLVGVVVADRRAPRAPLPAPS